jgi:hypothetical protein
MGKHFALGNGTRSPTRISGWFQGIEPTEVPNGIQIAAKPVAHNLILCGFDSRSKKGTGQTQAKLFLNPCAPGNFFTAASNRVRAILPKALPLLQNEGAYGQNFSRG